MRAFKATGTLPAGGRQFVAGDLVPDAEWSPNLRELLEVGYLQEVDVAELTAAERRTLEQAHQAHERGRRELTEQREREQAAGRTVAWAGSPVRTGREDVVLQENGRLEELDRGQPTIEAAMASAAAGRGEEPEPPADPPEPPVSEEQSSQREAPPAGSDSGPGEGRSRPGRGSGGSRR